MTRPTNIWEGPKGTLSIKGCEFIWEKRNIFERYLYIYIYRDFTNIRVYREQVWGYIGMWDNGMMIVTGLVRSSATYFYRLQSNVITHSEPLAGTKSKYWDFSPLKSARLKWANVSKCKVKILWTSSKIMVRVLLDQWMMIGQGCWIPQTIPPSHWGGREGRLTVPEGDLTMNGPWTFFHQTWKLDHEISVFWYSSHDGQQPFGRSSHQCLVIPGSKPYRSSTQGLVVLITLVDLDLGGDSPVCCLYHLTLYEIIWSYNVIVYIIYIYNIYIYHIYIYDIYIYMIYIYIFIHTYIYIHNTTKIPLAESTMSS